MGKSVLDLVWAKQQGWVSVPVRRASDGRWLERWFEWPQDRKLLLEYLKKANRQGDVYWSPLVYPEPSRTYAKECSSCWAWADVDEGDPDDGPKPTILWETSPGRTQALYRLTARVKADLLEKVNRGIASLTGADASGWDAGQVLRVPGSKNWKYEGRPKGRILRVAKARHDPNELAAKAPPLASPPPVELGDVPSFEQAVEQWLSLAPADVQQEVLHGEPVRGERSDRMIQVINGLVRAGLPDEVVYALAQGCPHNKWRGRANEEEILLTEISRAKEHSPALWVDDAALPEEPDDHPVKGRELIIRPWSENDWLYDYMEASAEAVPWASPWYHLAGGLACLATALDRARDLFLFAAVPSSTYIMTIGPSRSGKSEAQKFALRTLTATQTIKQHVPILTEWSPQGLARALQESPSRHVLSYHDEAAKLFAMSKADYMVGARDFLRELYDTEFYQKMLVKQIVRLERPCLTWYGAITPDQFTRYFTPEDLFDGTLPRFWLFYDPDATETEFEPIEHRMEIVADLAVRLDRIRDRVYNPQPARVFGTSVPVRHLHAYVEPEGYDVLNARLKERREAMSDRPELTAIMQNYGTDVLKFALFRAMAADMDAWAGATPITPAQIEEAFEVLNAAQDNSVYLVQQLGQGKDERLIELITKYLAQQPQGRASRTQIMQRYGRSIGRNMDTLEYMMVDRGLIEIEFRRSPNGRTVKHYRLRRGK